MDKKGKKKKGVPRLHAGHTKYKTIHTKSLSFAGETLPDSLKESTVTTTGVCRL